MNQRLHGKAMFHWCDVCNTLLLEDTCSKCRTKGREFLVSLPGDIRPALRRGHEVVSSLFMHHFGTDHFLRGKLIFLNKIAGEDRSDEIVVDGHVVAAMRFDLKENDFFLELRAPGSAFVRPTATKGLVRASRTEGHLKGKKLDAKDLIEVKGDFEAGDPLVVVVGNMICSGVAKVSSDRLASSEKGVLVRDIAPQGLSPSGKRTGRDDFVASNKDHLEKMESKAVSDIRSFIGNKRKPVSVSFSGGKDSLAAYGLLKRAHEDFDMIFIDTGIEFPETVRYVNRFAEAEHGRLNVAKAGNAFWEQVGQFGPPAKDFRWCCKVCKLGPVTDLIQAKYPQGTITVEGNRALESFSRSKIGFVESNPFVPNQTILNPIKDWNAAEVWAFIWWKGLEFNPLYEEDFERIGCYLCASCLGSEWKETARIDPELYVKWDEHLRKWAKTIGTSEDYAKYGLWRWKVLPPKMQRLAEEVGLKVPQMRTDRLDLKTTRGLSLCLTGGYSMEGVLTLPRKRDFTRVAESLKTVGKVKHSPEFEIAMVKDKECTLKVFGGGQIVATGPTSEKTQRFFERGVKALLKAQLCTRCGICVKQCRQRAIRIEDSPVIDQERCVQCGRCDEACVVAHYYDKLVTKSGAQGHTS
ncbi:MAG: phosphoadenosine phosphosulfate reductase family protein [Methanomassiliicoccales archaeon]|nr:MAG: phosphoadenosine phosphosulfate reductase family protein [Methanomassiliicoccales archaeon]